MNTKKLLIYILLFLLVLITSLYVITQDKKHSSTQVPINVSTNNQATIIERLSISIKVPSSYTVMESGNTVTLSNIENDTIVIDRIATDNSSLDEYLQSLSLLNNIEFTNIEEIGDKYGTHKGELDGQVVYFIYIDNYVYTFTTTDQNSEVFLATIVNSFEYLGEK